MSKPASEIIAILDIVVDAMAQLSLAHNLLKRGNIDDDDLEEIVTNVDHARANLTAVQGPVRAISAVIARQVDSTLNVLHVVGAALARHQGLN